MDDANGPKEAIGKPSKPPEKDLVRVVAVDDKPQLLDLYQIMFKDTRFCLIAKAGDGRSGVEAAVEHRADLVLMDLSMPDMDGLEALLELRRRRTLARVVVVTGFGRDRLGTVAEQLGASGFIEKGTRPFEVLEELERVMAQPAPRYEEPDKALLERARQLL